MPLTYNYEMHSQGVSHARTCPSNVHVNFAGRQCLASSLLTRSISPRQPGPSESFSRQTTCRSGEVYYAGPLVPLAEYALTGKVNSFQDAREVTAFLDEKLGSHGKQFVIYMSIAGSLFWLPDASRLWAVLYDSVATPLKHKCAPLQVVSHGAARVQPLPDHIKTAIADYGQGIASEALLTRWATGWYCIIPHTWRPQLHPRHDPCRGSYDRAAYRRTRTPECCLSLGDAGRHVRHAGGLSKLHRNSRTPVGTLDALHTEMHGVLGNALGEGGAKKLEPGHSFSRRHCSKPGFRTASRAGSPRHS
ncbi:hypothetical protein BD413DRAFT_627883 [Trametes elegans]|nr:hypothetical protein BD413DRAFT_627883 [Trametes elegans]